MRSARTGDDWSEVAAFTQRLEKKVDAIFGDSGQQSLEVLYHYAPWDGIRGILTSQTMWATHHKHTTDVEELRAAEDAIETVTNEMISETQAGKRREVLERFKEVYTDNRAADVATVYLTCFTTTRDCKKLWKDFARDEGACIGFRMLRSEIPPKTYDGCELARGFGRVMYDQSLLRHKIRDGFTKVLDELRRTLLLRTLQPDIVRAMLHEAGLQLAATAATAAVTSKGANFEFESEWRWTALPDPETRQPKAQTRPASATRRAYDYLPLEFRADGKRFDMLELIVNGPVRQDAVSAAKEILDAAGYTDETRTRIVVSEHCGP